MSKRAEFYIRGRELLAKPYHYEASGLPNIYLLNGVTVKDTSYGPMTHIHNVHGLHRAIGLHIAEQPRPMTGAEFRFLRRQMGHTQETLAERMLVSPQTIANYEKSHTEFGPAERLIRALYMMHILPAETRMKALKPLTERAPGRFSEISRRTVVQGWLEEHHSPAMA
jgi:DNA-binding transcriptional regulator YiaG